MNPIVEFCASNMHHGTDELLEQLEADPTIDAIEYGCLGNCGECYLFPFVLVNGEIVAAETVEELSKKIEAAVKEQQAHQDALDKLLDDL
ncbi:YuzB family protein [Paenibacillus daejeonensis]|uniref:YuzB family protein n=1 Tax=Paenibacillus daejeonensis TaxID=135193 RepID=UPI0003653E02|nr:YuzB family protein [Paenibacillus daejeonensis]